MSSEKIPEPIPQTSAERLGLVGGVLVLIVVLGCCISSGGACNTNSSAKSERESMRVCAASCGERGMRRYSFGTCECFEAARTP